MDKKKLAWGAGAGAGIGVVFLVLTLVLGPVMTTQANEAGVTSSVSGDMTVASPEDGAPGAVSGYAGDDAVPEEAMPPQEQANCSFEHMVGAPVDEDALKATGRPYRILPMGSMMTMDHSPDRINADTDEDGTVTRVWCG